MSKLAYWGRGSGGDLCGKVTLGRRGSAGGIGHITVTRVPRTSISVPLQETGCGNPLTCCEEPEGADVSDTLKSLIAT